MQINKEEIRRKIFFSDIYDYNYLTYNLLVVLNALDCCSESKAFNDHRVLGLIFELMNRMSITDVFIEKQNQGIQYNNKESIEVIDLYIRSKMVTKQLTKLLIALEKKGIVSLKNNLSYFSVWHNQSEDLVHFITDSVFREDFESFYKISKAISYTRKRKYETVVNQVMDKMGVTSWQI